MNDGRRRARGGREAASLAVSVTGSVIVAPGLVPSRPGDRVKTDKRDARRFARLHAAGLLTEIKQRAPAVGPHQRAQWEACGV